MPVQGAAVGAGGAEWRGAWMEPPPELGDPLEGALPLRRPPPLLRLFWSPKVLPLELPVEPPP